MSTNTIAFNVWTNYTENVTRLQKAMSKLSTGQITNTDDPAGIGISERMRAQIRGTAMARQNSETAVSLVQTADSWLQKINDQISRMKALSVEAEGITSASDKTNIQTEFKALQEEVTRITSRYTSAAKFNGLYLFRGGNGVAVVTGDQVDGIGGGTAGYYTGSSLYSGADITVAYQNQVNGGHTPGSLELVLWNGAGSVTAGDDTYANALNNFMATDTAIADWVNANVGIGGLDARAQALMPDRASLSSTDLLYLNRKCMDLVCSPAFLAASTSAWVEPVAGTGTAKNVTVQIGADVDQKIEITLKNLEVTNTAIIGTVHTYSYGTGTTVSASSHSSVTWASIIDVSKMSVSSVDSIGKIDSAIDFVANARASMGAQQKRIENTRSGLLTYEDNLQSAESKIRDIDMARETTNLSTYQVLTQASNAMLAQANSLGQGILTLLG